MTKETFVEIVKQITKRNVLINYAVTLTNIDKKTDNHVYIMLLQKGIMQGMKNNTSEEKHTVLIKNDIIFINYENSYNNISDVIYNINNNDLLQIALKIGAEFQSEENIEEIVNNAIVFELESLINEIHSMAQNDYKRRIESLEIIVANAKIAYISACRNIDIERRKGYAYDKEKELEHLKSELLKIKKHKLTKIMSIKDGKIEIITNDIILFEPINKKNYMIGSVKIYISLLSNAYVKIYPTSSGKRAFWRNSPHPHVNSDGAPCLGTAEVEFLNFITNKNYYAALVTVLNFLQSANIEDIAGRGVTCWDEIDENGKIIKKGKAYGEEFAMADEDENDGIQCPFCNNWFDEDNMVSTEDNGLICERCYEEDYSECMDCGNPFPNEELIDGYCEDCYHDLEESEEVW